MNTGTFVTIGAQPVMITVLRRLDIETPAPLTEAGGIAATGITEGHLGIGLRVLTTGRLIGTPIPEVPIPEASEVLCLLLGLAALGACRTRLH